MSYTRHHAIIVTSWNEKSIRKAHEAASKIFPHVSEIVESGMNGYSSFFVPPDGSKEGWRDSDIGNDQREIFKKWLKSNERYKDGSSSLSAIEVCYPEDDDSASVKIISP